MKSNKTTITGILGVLVVVLGAAQALLDGDPATNPNWDTVLAAISMGVGLIFARDNNVSSEQAGIK